MSTECEICCLSIKQNNEVTCPYCNYKICTKCFRKYILESIRPADCMNCHKDFSLDFVISSTSKSFTEIDYRNKRVADLLSQEKSLLPTSQDDVERKIVEREYRNKIKNLEREKRNLNARIREINAELLYLTHHRPEHIQKNIHKVFIMKCSVENCRGFLSTAWKCGTCGEYTCSKCRVAKNKDLEHICNPDDVATATLLKHDTKPCPKCAVPIYKIDGCDQMFCVECHVPFSWETSEIIKGTIHNPHYFEWQRKRLGNNIPRVPGDIENICGNVPTFEKLVEVLDTNEISFPKLDNSYSLIGHIRGVTMAAFHCGDRMTDNTDLRVQYLMNDFDEKEWIKQLKMRQKKYEKNIDVTQILEMFINTMGDIFSTFVVNPKNTLEEELESLREYTNTELIKIEKRYNNVTPFIDENWKIIPNKW